MKHCSMRSRLFIALPLVAYCLAPSISYADYFGEVTAVGIHTNADSQVKTDTYLVVASIYQGSVSTENAPLNEAAFLSKQSSVSIGYVEVEVEEPLGDTEGDSTIISTQQILAEKFIIGAAYSTGDIEGTDIDIYGAEIGAYLNDTTSLTLDAFWVDNELDTEVRDTYTLRIHTVAETYGGNKVGGSGYIGSGALPGGGSANSLGGTLDYYFNANWSIGGGFDLVLPNGDKNKTSTYSVRSDYFITEFLAIGAGFSLTIFHEEDEDNSVDNTETFEVRITGRI